MNREYNQIKELLKSELSKEEILALVESDEQIKAMRITKRDELEKIMQDILTGKYDETLETLTLTLWKNS